MQHLDEGTIHSWLDDALPPDEMARVESHVAECEECRAAVAEARGFVAASSRILTALDDVPRGVIPIAPAGRRHLRPLWRAAAAVLVVAGGSFLVLRDGEQSSLGTSATNDSARTESAVSSASKQASPTVAPVASQSSVRALPAPPVTPSSPSRSDDGADKRLSAGTRSENVAGPVLERRGATAPVDLRVARGSTGGATALDVMPATAQAPESAQALRVVREQQQTGSRYIVYAVGPIDTVTLTELDPTELSFAETVVGAVTTQADMSAKAARPTERRAQALSAPSSAPAPAPAAATAQKNTDSTAAAAPIRIRGATLNAGANTIRWIDSGTGKTLILSGKLSVEKLQGIKGRIEKERAATAKKAP